MSISRIPVLTIALLAAFTGCVTGQLGAGEAGDDETPPPNTLPPPTTLPSAGRLGIAGNRIIDDRGESARLTGLNWFGLETSGFAPHGLWQRSMDSILDQIAAAGFNTLRVPFSNRLLEPGATPSGIDAGLNPDLAGASGLEVLDALIAKASTRRLRIILDRHRPDETGQSALWYTAATPETRWIADWVMLAQRYRANPMVVAFDLHNEPHDAATWGDGNAATDWRLAAQRAGNAILAVHPEILIIVEGVQAHEGDNYWWGGNLRGVAAAPVQLDIADRVIYSPHEYPASLYPHPWFSAPTYPANLTGVWDATWGYVARTAPVLIGEFGTKLATEGDRQWLAELVRYIQANQLSFTFWSLNPNSGDTGGILADDWLTLDAQKMGYLGPALAPR